jgi:hypothetical protein
MLWHQAEISTPVDGSMIQFESQLTVLMAWENTEIVQVFAAV